MFDRVVCWIVEDEREGLLAWLCEGEAVQDAE
jgi:hypothetical protein